MSGLTRTRRRSCAGKLRHGKRGGAEAQRRRMINLGASASRLTVYRCKFCAGFHLGHIKWRRR